MWSGTHGADFALAICLFVAVKLNKNVDSDQYKYSDYGTEFDAHGSFSLSDVSGFGKNVMIFCALFFYFLIS